MATKASSHLEHFALSLVHVARDNEIVGTAHRMLTRDQEFGNNAGHLSAVLDGQTLATAPIIPTEPPPKTRPMPFLARDECRRRAALSTKAGSMPGPEPQ